jgi:hypothetical protein
VKRGKILNGFAWKKRGKNPGEPAFRLGQDENPVALEALLREEPAPVGQNNDSVAPEARMGTL